jgi:tetratricopeptide (TPR) repeat protein
LTVFTYVSSAQTKDNRTVKKLVNEGNQHYSESDYVSAETLYKDALDENPRSPVARFNLANSLFKQDKFDDALRTYDDLLKDEHVNYNIGNVYLKKEEYDKAIEAYKASLRRDPSDIEAKSNLAYAQQKLQQQQQQQQQNQQNDSKDNSDKDQSSGDKSDKQNDPNKDNQEQNKDQDKNPDQPKDNGDNKDNRDQPDKQNGDNKENNDKPDNSKGQSSAQPEISKSEADYILNAVEANEKNTREKAQKVNAARASANQPEKNW